MGYVDSGTFIIHVDFCREGVLSGQFHHPWTGQTDNFSSVMQLLLKIQQFLDEDDGPQSFHQLRNFRPQEHHPEGNISHSFPCRGKIATFCVNILFRRNASWQGTLVWLEGEQTQHFRSVLELMLLISSAVTARQRK